MRDSKFCMHCSNLEVQSLFMVGLPLICSCKENFKHANIPTKPRRKAGLEIDMTKEDLGDLTLVKLSK